MNMDPLEKAKANPQSLRAAINGMCYYCMGGGGDGEGITKRQIRECDAPECPLHAVRPYQHRESIPDPDTSPSCASEGPS